MTFVSDFILATWNLDIDNCSPPVGLFGSCILAGLVVSGAVVWKLVDRVVVCDLGSGCCSVDSVVVDEVACGWMWGCLEPDTVWVYGLHCLKNVDFSIQCSFCGVWRGILVLYMFCYLQNYGICMLRAIRYISIPSYIHCLLDHLNYRLGTGLGGIYHIFLSDFLP